MCGVEYSMPPDRLQSICRSLSEEIAKLGFPAGEVAGPDAARIARQAVRDPYTGAENTHVQLQDRLGRKAGEVRFNSDRSFYAEYAVIRPHPHNPRWFVDCVVAWGNDGTIKSEPKLLPALE